MFCVFHRKTDKYRKSHKQQQQTNKKACHDINKTIESREPSKDNQTQVLQMPTTNSANHRRNFLMH